MSGDSPRTAWKRALLIGLMAMMAVTAAVGPALAASEVQQSRTADLSIEQPRHVSEPVDEQTQNGSKVYVARGQHLEIRPENFNSSDVTNFGVREDVGVLNYDKRANEYVLNTQGNSGTYHLRWTVSNNNSTAVYTAQIRVVTANYATLPGDQYQKLQQDAQRGQEIQQKFDRAGDPSTPTEDKIEFSVNVLNFKNNPFSVFTGQFMAIQIMRFSTPAGWADMGIILAILYVSTRGLYATIARLRKQLEKEEQVSRREDRQYRKMISQTLAGTPITDVDSFDDHQTAVWSEKLGPNLKTALDNFWSVWGADNMKRMYADAMGTLGYRARVQRDDHGDILSVDVLEPGDRDAHTDGGEDHDPDDIDSPGVDPAAAELGNRETYQLNECSDEVTDALEWSQIDSRVFVDNPDISAIDHLMVSNRESDRDLITELNIQIPEDFESRKAFMESVADFLREVQESDFTDDEGIPREDREILNNIHAFTSVMSQQYGLPLDLYWKAAIWNAEGLNRDDQAESVLDDITDAGSVMDDIKGGVEGGY